MENSYTGIDIHKVHAEIISKAACKFGQVIQKNIDVCDGTGRVAIKRDNPTFKDRPYMTIYGTTQGFFWGHYDLTLEDAINDLKKQ